MSHTEQSDSRPVAEENFKAVFGQYPQRVEFPEPEPDAATRCAEGHWFTLDGHPSPGPISYSVDGR